MRMIFQLVWLSGNAVFFCVCKALVGMLARATASGAFASAWLGDLAMMSDFDAYKLLGVADMVRFGNGLDRIKRQAQNRQIELLRLIIIFSRNCHWIWRVLSHGRIIKRCAPLQICAIDKNQWQLHTVYEYFHNACIKCWHFHASATSIKCTTSVWCATGAYIEQERERVCEILTPFQLQC